jgi:drug/metabolite transporter (DMT)-like permease
LVVKSPPKSAYTRGTFYGLAAVCIWGAFIVVSRLGVRTSLTPWDVAAIRFAAAGVLLIPYLAKRGLALDRLGWKGVTAIVCRVRGAPAAHGGALFPGVMPLIAGILASIVLKELFTLNPAVGRMADLRSVGDYNPW